ncbi:Nuclear transcription factor Y subunit C-4 [Dorcoceras hygrometricum]|uniref:Nuclear transcription factor Y subunit C-4 n=1 Tax=Dorcoceras hygrometricum TaxID=472368 RepID=A0A2Z7CN82_9LAMI|nr:Nuclear transcription factor Y subunit C-4 [Dorcoceras hygrometricum]
MKRCTDLVIHPLVQTTETIPDRVFRFFITGSVLNDFVNSAKKTAAKLGDQVSSMSSEKLQSEELLTSFKSYFNERIKSLELIVESCIYATRRGTKQSDDVNSSVASLRSQLTEVVAHLKRAGDVKKGEGGNNSS